jgi:elongation factor G
MSAATESIRNIVLAGHGSTGKTTLVEKMLYTGGIISEAETVESGKTTSDFVEEEISRKISIHTSLTHINWKDVKINILDTPGSSDFVGEIIAAQYAAESALVIVGADTGVQIETIKIWRRLDDLNYPRCVFINKMDKEHADFTKSLDDLKDKFKAQFFPVFLPIGKESGFEGIVNLLDQKAYMHSNGEKPTETTIPDDMKAAVEEQRVLLMEAAAEGDDTLMEKYLEEETLTDDEIIEGIRKALADNKCVPVMCGAALLNSGVQPLLDFIQAAAPYPSKEVEVRVKDEEGKTQRIDAAAPASCFVFKTSLDQFSGKLSYIKVITGKITPESELINSRNSEKERITKLYMCQGKNLEDVKELAAGDLGILNKLDSAETWDSLCSSDAIVEYVPPRLPQPAHGVSVSAVSKKDEDKLNQLLQKEAQEDPTFILSYNKETKETVISSMGELHLNIILNKIKSNQKIEVETKIPKVAYRETINKSSGAEYQHKKQTGGHGQFAKVVLEIKPLPRGENFKFVNAIFGGSIPKGYIPGVEKGIIEGMESGILAGYPVVDIEARVVDGKHHPVDSSEMSFKLASRGALRDAMEKASSVLLEPVMHLEVFVDDQYLGDVLSDLSSRRGRVQGQEPIGGGIQLIKAQVPQAELLRYSIDLKAITSGTGSFEMEFDHYSPITGRIADDVIKAAKSAEN